MLVGVVAPVMANNPKLNNAGMRGLIKPYIGGGVSAEFAGRVHAICTKLYDIDGVLEKD